GVLVVEVQTVDLFARQEGRVAGFGDFDFLHHLADNHFDVLVVQLHALQTIDVLNLVDEIDGQGFDAQDRQDLMRDRGAINQDVAFLDQIAFLNDNVLAFRDQVFGRFATLFVHRHDRNAALGLVVLAEFDAAFDFRDDRGFFRTARFEQFGDTRQTAGDVARLGRLTRDAGDDVAGFDLGAVLNAQDRTDRQVVYRFGAGWQLLRVAFVILQ